MLLTDLGDQPEGLAFPAGWTARAHRPQGGKLGQFSAAVGAITALNRMMALGADQKGFRGHSNHHYRR